MGNIMTVAKIRHGFWRIEGAEGFLSRLRNCRKIAAAIFLSKALCPDLDNIRGMRLYGNRHPFPAGHRRLLPD